MNYLQGVNAVCPAIQVKQIHLISSSVPAGATFMVFLYTTDTVQ